MVSLEEPTHHVGAHSPQTNHSKLHGVVPFEREQSLVWCPSSSFSAIAFFILI
jgi:hypothetical protein